MTTNLDVITDSYRKANVINDRETLSSKQANQGLVLLNDMMSDWEEDGIELGYYPVTLNEDIPIDDKHLRGVKYNLSRAVAGDNSLPLSQEVLRIAELTYARLEKATTENMDADFSHMPNGFNGTYDVFSDT
jgi:hypothetical protein